MSVLLSALLSLILSSIYSFIEKVESKAAWLEESCELLSCFLRIRREDREGLHYSELWIFWAISVSVDSSSSSLSFVQLTLKQRQHKSTQPGPLIVMMKPLWSKPFSTLQHYSFFTSMLRAPKQLQKFVIAFSKKVREQLLKLYMFEWNKGMDIFTLCLHFSNTVLVQFQFNWFIKYPSGRSLLIAGKRSPWNGFLKAWVFVK